MARLEEAREEVAGGLGLQRCTPWTPKLDFLTYLPACDRQ